MGFRGRGISICGGCLNSYWRGRIRACFISVRWVKCCFLCYCCFLCVLRRHGVEFFRAYPMGTPHGHSEYYINTLKCSLYFISYLFSLFFFFLFSFFFLSYSFFLSFSFLFISLFIFLRELTLIF